MKTSRDILPCGYYHLVSCWARRLCLYLVPRPQTLNSSDVQFHRPTSILFTPCHKHQQYSTMTKSGKTDAEWERVFINVVASPTFISGRLSSLLRIITHKLCRRIVFDAYYPPSTRWLKPNNSSLLSIVSPTTQQLRRHGGKQTWFPRMHCGTIYLDVEGNALRLGREKWVVIYATCLDPKAT